MKLLGGLIVIAVAGSVAVLAGRDPDLVLGTALSLFWAVVILRVLYGFLRRALDTAGLRTLLVVGLFARLPMVLAHLVVGFVILGGAIDFPGYFTEGVRLGRQLLEGNLELFELPLDLPPETGTLVVNRLSAMTFLLIGPNLPGMLFVSGIVGFLGSYLFLRAFQVEFPEAKNNRFLVLSLFFFPSLSFWTSVLGKDSWMYFFLGGTAYWLAQLFRRGRPRDLIGLLFCVAFVVLIRRPIGVALIAAAGAAFAVAVRSRLLARGPAVMLRPLGYAVVGIVLVVGALTMPSLVTNEFQESEVELTGSEIVLNVAVRSHVSLSSDTLTTTEWGGGSSLAAGVHRADFAEALRYLPLGIFTFLFRPFPFEAHNAVALLAALDSSILLGLVLWRWRHLAAAVRAAVVRPFVTFCGTAFLLFVMGLAFQSNFGVIARHRTMVLGFVFILLAVPRPREPATPVAEPIAAPHALGVPAGAGVRTP